MHFGVFLRTGHCQRRFSFLAIFPILFFLSGTAPGLAAEAGHGFDGTQLGLVWITPFVGILLSIALLPLLFAPPAL
jgi:hypothetical protein